MPELGAIRITGDLVAAGWLMIGARVNTLPESPDRGLHVVVPKADVFVDDTCYTLGLPGFGRTRPGLDPGSPLCELHPT